MLYDPVAINWRGKMDHWVKCTVTDGDSVHYINLDHVVTMYPISNDRETKIIFSGAGDIISEGKPSASVQKHGQSRAQRRDRQPE
jgi:hypothetical protein